MVVRDLVKEPQLDIICMQEVARFNLYRKLLWEQGGFVGVFQNRTGREDGCAIFWKPDKFDVEKVDLDQEEKAEIPHAFKFHKLEMGQHPELEGKTNVALGVTLTLKDTKEQISVFNTHLLYNPRRGDLKSVQVKMVCDFIADSIGISAENPSKRVVLAGDFNCTPWSPLMEFLRCGNLPEGLGRTAVDGQAIHNFRATPSRDVVRRLPHIPRAHIKPTVKFMSPETMEALRWKMWTPAALSSHAVKGQTHKLGPFFTSSYWPWHPLAEGRFPEPMCTQFHSSMFGNVDYLWYGGPDLHLQRVIAPPTLTKLVQKPGRGFGLVGLPSLNYPSDHVLIAAEYQLGTGECNSGFTPAEVGAAELPLPLSSHVHYHRVRRNRSRRVRRDASFNKRKAPPQ